MEFEQFPEQFTGGFCAGLSRIDLAEDEFKLGEGIVLRQTFAQIFAPFLVAFKPAPPGEHTPGPWKSASAGFSYEVRAEIDLDPHICTSNKDKLDLCNSIVFLIRLGFDPGVIMPFVCNRPFSQAKEAKSKDTSFLAQEIMPRFLPLSVEAGIQFDGLTAQWVKDRIETVLQLRKCSEEFELLLQAMHYGQFINNPALAMVSIWGAMERVFCKDSRGELRFRLSALLASFLEPPGLQRSEKQKAIKKLYDGRCAAAHGGREVDAQSLLDSFELLRSTLLKIIDGGSVPGPEELLSLLMCNSEGSEQEEDTTE